VAAGKVRRGAVSFPRPEPERPYRWDFGRHFRAAELFRNGGAQRERGNGTPTGTLRGRRVSRTIRGRQHAGNKRDVGGVDGTRTLIRRFSQVSGGVGLLAEGPHPHRLASGDDVLRDSPESSRMRLGRGNIVATLSYQGGAVRTRTRTLVCCRSATHRAATATAQC
jgi:hypothetical protein